jgi:hypothetical protein
VTEQRGPLARQGRPAGCPAPDHRLSLSFARRLRGHLAGDRDLFDMFVFQRVAADLLGRWLHMVWA